MDEEEFRKLLVKYGNAVFECGEWGTEEYEANMKDEGLPVPKYDDLAGKADRAREAVLQAYRDKGKEGE